MRRVEGGDLAPLVKRIATAGCSRRGDLADWARCCVERRSNGTLGVSRLVNFCGSPSSCASCQLKKVAPPLRVACIAATVCSYEVARFVGRWRGDMSGETRRSSLKLREAYSASRLTR